MYGLQSDFLEWIHSYMSNRYQSVWIDHVFSPCLPLDVGVPQGSNLGPLFFLLFANDLATNLGCDIVQYADDSTLSASCKTLNEVQNILEISCEAVRIWMAENQLQLNADKTHVMILGTDQRIRNLDVDQFKVQMNGVNLEESEGNHEVLLGCWIQSNLKWAKHITELSKKMKKRLVAIAHLKFVLPFQQRKLVADGLLNSVLAYCLPLFGGCTQSEVKDLQILQNKAARIVCHAPYWASRKMMFDHLDWLTVRQMVHYFTLIAVYRMEKTGEPEHFSKCFRTVNKRGSIIVKHTKLSLFKHSFRLRGSTQWNDLPMRIRNLDKLASFKKYLRQWIKENVPRFYE